MLVLKNLEELIFNMAHIFDKIVFGFSITFMVLFAIPVVFFGIQFYRECASLGRHGRRISCAEAFSPAFALAIYNFTSTTVSVILLSVKIFAISSHELNLAMRVIWTVIQGIAVIILTLQAISPGLIYRTPVGPGGIGSQMHGLIWIPGLIIIIPMFIYGIIESWSLNT